MTDNEIRTEIQKNIYKLRTDAQLTQTEFGNIFDKKKTTVATWEQGKALPDPETLYRIAKYFDKTVGFIYGEDKDREN